MRPGHGRSRRASAFALLLTAMLCIPASSARAASIADAPWTAVIEAPGKSPSFCTGALIDAQHVVASTACAHGFTDGAGYDYVPGMVHVIAGVDQYPPPPGAGQEADVSQIRVHPYFTDGVARPDDVAVFTLAAPLALGPDVRPIGLAPFGPPPADTSPAVTFSSFSSQAPSPSSAALRLTSATPADAGTCTPSRATEMCLQWPSDERLCGGDGYPATALLDGSPVLLGVSSRGTCTGDGDGVWEFLGAGELSAFVAGQDQPPRAPIPTAGPTGVSYDRDASGATVLHCQPPTFANPVDSVGYRFAWALPARSSFAEQRVVQDGPSRDYQLQDADFGQWITCAVTATNAGGVYRALAGAGRVTHAAPAAAAVAAAPGASPMVAAASSRTVTVTIPLARGCSSSQLSLTGTGVRVTAVRRLGARCRLTLAIDASASGHRSVTTRSGTQAITLRHAVRLVAERTTVALHATVALARCSRSQVGAGAGIEVAGAVTPRAGRCRLTLRLAPGAYALRVLTPRHGRRIVLDLG